jgi:hypothetical protein
MLPNYKELMEQYIMKKISHIVYEEISHSPNIKIIDQTRLTSGVGRKILSFFENEFNFNVMDHCNDD